MKWINKLISFQNIKCLAEKLGKKMCALISLLVQWVDIVSAYFCHEFVIFLCEYVCVFAL